MIKKITISITLLLWSIIGFGQELSKVKSEKHVQIEGTNIFMVPPSSFESSSNFKGFQNPEDPTSMIMVMEIPGPYTEVNKGFKTDMMKARGMDLITKNEIKVDKYDGLLIEINQSANGMIFSKQLLIYGNEESTTIINGVYLKDSTQLGERIKQSVLTTFIDLETKSDPRAALNYEVNEDAGSLKFKTVMGNSMLFNRDLKIPTESIDKVSLLIDKSFAKVAIDDKKLFCLSRLKKYPEDFSLDLSKGINEIELDNLKGFELFAKNTKNESEEMYQVILFEEDGGYYLFVGTYLTGSDQAITDIKNVVRSFKRKL